MAFLIPFIPEVIAGILAAAGVGLTVAAVEAHFIPAIQVLDDLRDVVAMTTGLDRLIDELPSHFTAAQVNALVPLVNALKFGVNSGAIHPGELQAATAYALELSGGSSANVADLTERTLQARMTQYGQEVGNIPASGASGATTGPTATSPAVPVQPPFTVPAVPSAPTSPFPTAPTTGLTPTAGQQSTGNLEPSTPSPLATVVEPTLPPAIPASLVATVAGKAVATAESQLKPVKITLPGVTPATAGGIGLAIQAAYRDAIGVLVRVANGIESRITAIATDLTTAENDAKAAQSAAADASGSLSGFESSVNTRIGNIEDQLDAINGEITGIDGKIAALPGEVAGSLPAAPPTDLSGVEGQIQGIDAQLPGLATKDQLDQLANSQAGTAAEVGTIAATVAGIAALSLETVVPDLELCCSANSEITGPIRGGGATPSLLGNLGGLLEKAAAIGIVLSILDAIDQMWDANAVDLASVATAEKVAGWVDDLVVPAVLAQVTAQAAPTKAA